VPAPHTRVVQLADARLHLAAEDAALLEPVTLVYGECSPVSATQTAGADVYCGLSRGDRPAHLLISFQGDALPDLAGVALAVLHPPRNQPRYRAGELRPDGWRLVGGEDRPVVATDGRRILVDTDRVPGDFVAELLAGVAFALQRQLLVVHAAALRIGGRGVLLTGPSHGGKTTTAAHLASRGHALLGDELSALRLSSGELVPVRRAMTLRAGPREPDLAARLLADRSAALRSAAGRSGPHRIDRLFGEAPAGRVRLGGLFVLSGFAGEPHCEPFQPTLADREVFEYLVANDVALISWGLTAERHVLSLMALRHILSRTRCWRLTLGPPAATARLIERRMEST
jgi:hypothetical protein